MNSPAERLAIATNIADLVLNDRSSEERTTLANNLGEALIHVDELRRFEAILRNHLQELGSTVSDLPSTGPANGGNSDDKAEFRERMIAQVIDGITQAAGIPPGKSEGGNRQTYRCGNGPTIYVRTNRADDLVGNHERYWFGLHLRCWEDPEAWFILQCGLEFTLVVPVADWLPYIDQIGQSEEGDQRQPHVHREDSRIELRESSGLILDVGRWVDNWGHFAEAHQSG